MVKKLDGKGFDEVLQAKDSLIVVDFTTDWCPYCKKLAPVIEQIAGEYGDKIEVYFVNTDEQPELAERYDIMTIPSVFVFQNGEVLNSAVNPRGKEAVIDLIFGSN